jgi:Family of unknown function (DUF6116)
MSYASRLRFPKLFALTAGLFLLDLIIPDIIPFADEILLGLFTLMLGSLRKQRAQETGPQEMPKKRLLNGPKDSP